MTNWVRLWEDMPTDPKWRVIARRSGRPLSEVIAVFVFMMTNAGANAADRGRLSNWDDEDVAAALDMDGDHVSAIRLAMEGKTIIDGQLTGWEKRQPKREDNSTGRVAAWRDKKKREEATENAHETQLKRDVTQCNAPEKNRIDTDISPSLRSGDTRARRALAVEAKDAAKAFERFWEIWPNKTGKPVAIKSFFKVWREADAICAGVERYIADKPPDRPWLNPATFLNQRRWEDAPAPVANARAGPPGDRGGFASMLIESYEAGNGRESTGDIENLPPLSIAHGPAVERETGHDGGIFGRLPRPDG